MENHDMKITPQDIIDKEFRVKFRGFDMSEVDAFLEEVAENFFRLTEENTLLNEKILALQQELESSATRPPPAQLEFPSEITNTLEDLRQDTAAIGTEISALKQDRQTFVSIEKNLKSALAYIQELGSGSQSQVSHEIPVELTAALESFKKDSATLAADLASLKAERQSLETLVQNLETYISSAREAAEQKQNIQPPEIPGDLPEALAEFKQASETLGSDLAALKTGLEAIPSMRQTVVQEVQELLASHFRELEDRLAALSVQAALRQTPTPMDRLPVAEIMEEPEGHVDERSLPDYRTGDVEDSEVEDLEFLTEDDILDVDKLRGIFQTVLDESVSDSHESRYSDDVTADLLFLEDDFIDDEPEPKVTLTLGEDESPQKPKNKKP